MSYRRAATLLLHEKDEKRKPRGVFRPRGLDVCSTVFPYLFDSGEEALLTHRRFELCTRNAGFRLRRQHAGSRLSVAALRYFFEVNAW